MLGAKARGMDVREGVRQKWYYLQINLYYINKYNSFKLPSERAQSNPGTGC